MMGPRSRFHAQLSLLGMWTLTGTIFLSTGCASSTAHGPAWPEQPGPSYPEPPAYQGPLGEKEKASPAPKTQSPPPSKVTKQAAPAASHSTLAKEFEGKPSLKTLSGKATYYADSLAGNHTANGDVYDIKKFTAAHKKLPFGTIVRVTRIDSGAVTYVRVNDRGPFGAKERIIDLSRAAAEDLKMIQAGVIDVKVEIVKDPSQP
ncbi:MAG: septal ring lytic transglycosylase RlpA family protein [Polyangiaceae bacterium]|nr:septal ring lytic transglycosylase RlpA family protein [Polyangiaceae bacterium]